jgi:alkanesulfonate monooxygenase SsuD/methylene tetrahydromethanopterin reductase-like flavin-dependent oxidoreductase (luciferase family)
MDRGANPLSIGVFFHCWATGERRDADVLDEILDSTERADQLGFDIAWYTEQHTRTFGNIWGRVTAPHLLIAHAAARTRAIGLGTAVRLACDHDAAALVDEMVTLDLLCGGRARFGFGAGTSGAVSGPGERQMRRELFRIRMGDIAEMLAAGTGARTPDLAEHVYVASMDERSIEMAAQHGFGYLAGLFGGARPAKAIELFHSAGGRGACRAVRMVYVAESDASAMRSITSVAQQFWSDFTPPSPQWRQAKLKAPHVTIEDILLELGWVVGGPESVTAELLRYVSSSGLDGLDVSFHVPGLERRVANRSMEVFAKQVVPALRSAGAANLAGCR